MADHSLGLLQGASFTFIAHIERVTDNKSLLTTRPYIRGNESFNLTPQPPRREQSRNASADQPGDVGRFDGKLSAAERGKLIKMGFGKSTFGRTHTV
jgi:hypothetical protein